MFRSCVQSYKIYTEPPTLGKPKYKDATPLAHRMATRSAAHTPYQAAVSCTARTKGANRLFWS